MSKNTVYHKGTMNRATIIGRLKEVPVLKQMNDSVIATISLASTFSTFDVKEEQYVEKTEWHSIFLQGELAKLVERVGRPGQRFLIEGPVRNRTFIDKKGHERSVTEIIAAEVKPFDAINTMQIDKTEGTINGEQSV